MVSGWDKSPGPDNHYASGPVTRREVIVLVLIFLIVSCGIGYVFYPVS
jgi:hypothetical protein